MDALLFTPDFDDRFERNHITSRIGLHSEAVGFNDTLDLYQYACIAHRANPKITCVLLDEAQFLNRDQVHQLTDVVDTLKLPVLAYGLRTDFRGGAFFWQPVSLSLGG
jgi:thymidine kinase